MQNDPVNFIDPSGLTMSDGGFCGAQYSFSDCGGMAGIIGGYFGGDYAAYQREFGGMSQEAASGYAQYLLQREVDDFFRRLPEGATYRGGMSWGYTPYTIVDGQRSYSATSYTITFSMSRGLDAYFNPFAGGFVIGGMLTTANGSRPYSDPFARAFGGGDFNGGAAGGGWDAPNFFRGGTDLTPNPNEYKLKDGLVQPTHGISVFTNPAKIPARFDVYKVTSVPATLQIIQRGIDSEHYEITPRSPMLLQTYKTELNKITLAPHPR